MAQILPPGLAGFVAAEQNARNAGQQNIENAMGLQRLLIAREEMAQRAQDRALNAEMQPLRMQQLQAQIAAQAGAEELRRAQIAEMQRKGMESQRREVALGGLASLLAQPFQGVEGQGAPAPTSVAMTEADALRQVQEAEARGQPARVDVPNPGTVRGLAVAADPQRAIPEILKNQNPRQYAPHTVVTDQGVFGVGANNQLQQLTVPGTDKPLTVTRGQGTRGGAAATSGGTELTPDALDLRARQYLSGDPRAMSNLGRGAQGDQRIIEITNRAAEILREQGGSPQEIGRRIAEYRANANSLSKLTQSYDAIVAFEQTAVRNGEILKTLADKVDTTGVPVVERWIRAGRQNVAGDDDVNAFNAQLQVYRTEAARILTNPNLSGQLTDSARREVEEFMGPGISASQVRRTVDLLKNDFDNRKKTLEQQINAARDRIQRNVGPGEGAPAAPAPAAAPSAAPVWNDDKERRYQELLRKRGGT